MTNLDPAELAQAKSLRPLLSIIIPTYNRQEFAASAIRCALAIPSDDIEIVVQDCSDDDRLSSLIVPELLDQRLSYRFERPAFMAENWDRAIGRATGEYICIIGDDDGVNPEIMQAAVWAKSNSFDCLAPKNTVHYRWPGTGTNSRLFPTLLSRPLPGSLLIYPFQGYLTTVVDIEAELRKLVQDGGAYFIHFNLPMPYYGLVHRRCLDAVREKTGAYCSGLSPDMFLSLAIACTAPRLAVTDYPLTIPGACKSSNSNVASILRKQSLRLNDHPEISDTGYRWSGVVPPVYTVPAIWADAAVLALLAMGRGDLVQQLNLPRLAAHCVRANSGVATPVLRGMFSGLRTTHKNIAIGMIKFAWNLIEIAAEFQIDRIERLLMTIRRRGRQRIDGLNNMVETSQALTRYLNENGWSFAQRALRNTQP